MNRKDKNEILDYKAVYNHKVSQPNNLKSATIETIFAEIKTSSTLKAQIEALNKLKTEDMKKKYKQAYLPYFNLGTFKGNYRLNRNLESSLFFIYDYDHLDSILDEIKSRLQKDPLVFGYFVSPRGNGLKVIYRLDQPITDYNLFSAVYKHYAKVFNIDLGAESDKTSDASRPCYFSYDPELYCNPNAETLKTDVQINIPVRKAFEFSEAFDFEVDMVLLKRAVDFIQTQKITYNDWIACGLALAPLGEIGRELFQIVSDNKYFNDSPAEIDIKFQNLVQHPMKYNPLDTLYLIAARYGFEIIQWAK